MDDHDRVERALRPLWEHDGATLLPEQAAVLLVWPASGVLGNGGFFSLVECLGDRADEVVAAFTQVGLLAHAAAVASGFALFPGRSHDDPDVRISLFPLDQDEAEARVSKADEQWFGLPDDAVAEAVAAYVREHPEAFPGAEQVRRLTS